VELSYDRFGRLIGWKWDELTERYEYDRSGRLFEIEYADGTSLTFTFSDLLTTLVSPLHFCILTLYIYMVYISYNAYFALSTFFSTFASNAIQICVCVLIMCAAWNFLSL